MVDIVSSAFNDALPLMRSRQRVYLVLAMLAALCGLALPFFPPIPMTTMTPSGTPVTTTMSSQMYVAIWSAELWGLIAMFWALPAIVRTAKPGFRMTAGVVFTLIGISLVVGLATAVAMIFLIIPGIWVGVKLTQSTWAYLVGDGANPFAESWNVTTGQFWETILFYIFVGIVAAAIVAIGFFVPGYIVQLLPIAGVVMVPIMFLVYLYVLHFELIAGMRWFLHLRERRQTAAPVMTAPATV